MTVMRWTPAVAAALMVITSASHAARFYPSFGTPVPVYSGRSDYYRDHPREDPEPFRCDYAADSTCPGRTYSGWTGDPRDDPEPFRCTYAADADCPNGGKSGIQ